MDKIPLKYKDRREEGETTLRQCQLVQLHLLYVVDAICKKHNIKYFLDSGTLLGAMRHNGFIPWDDDLDIAMMKSEYRKFLKVVRQELPDDVIIHTPDDTPERVIAFTKIKDAYSFFAEQSKGVTLARHNGIFIDVVPYEDFPNVGMFLEKKLSHFCKWSWHYARALRCSGGRGWFFALFGGWLALPVFAAHYLVKGFVKALLIPFPAKNFHYDLRVPFLSIKPKSCIDQLIMHQFEDGEFPVPVDSDVFLTCMYGDWRKLPPPEKRTCGHAKLIDPFRSLQILGVKEWK